MKATEIFDPDSIEFELDGFREKNYLTHNFHPYPAKFVPQIPRLLINALSSKGNLVLDPFCGCGTTLVEASLLGRPSVGVDVNPISCLVSQVKTKPLTGEQRRQVIRVGSEIRSKAFGYRFGSAELTPSSLPDFKNRDHWFLPHVLRELAVVREEIWRTSKGAARDFLEVAFSSILVRVSNQDSETRWVAVSKDLPEGVVFDAFLRKLNDMLKRSQAYEKEQPALSRVIHQSATEALDLEDSVVQLVVTSPPYLNSFDYYLYHKLRLFWLEYDHRRVQEDEIGSRNRHSDSGEGLEEYLEPIRKTLREMRRVLRAQGYLAIVIGDAILRGRFIEMGTVYKRVFSELGLTLVRNFRYDQRKYTTSFTSGLQTRPKQTHILIAQR